MTGQRREYTHFYKIPMTDPTPAWERLVETYPEFGNAADLQASQAAFLAGYFCHLQADQRWLVEIFDPHFGPGQSWETFSRRLTVHNILRAYYDLHLVNELPKDTAAVLQGAAIQKWLPFVADRDLQAWCEFLASQLLPGAQIQTVEVFAARQGLAVETFNQVLLSEEQMETEVFSKIPRRTLGRYRRRLLDENADFFGSLPFWSVMKDFL